MLKCLNPLGDGQIKLTKEKRDAFKVQVVKKKKRTDGTTSVSGTHIADMLAS